MTLQQWLLGALLLLIAVVAFGPSRRLLIAQIQQARIKARWQRAIRETKPFGGAGKKTGVANQLSQVLGTPVTSAKAPPPTARIRRIHTIKAGHRLSVVVPKGASVEELVAKAPALAASLEVRDVRVTRDAHNARWAWVTIVRRNPLADALPPWPNLDAARLSIWNSIPVGMDEGGNVVRTNVVERHLLIGGEPGSGKSITLSMFVATAALDPNVKLWLFDGKMVELRAWAECAERTVEVSTAEACEVLADLQAVMEERYRSLKENKKRKVEPGDGLALHVIVVDELAHYFTNGSKEDIATFKALMRDMVSRGRAAGIIVIAATQKPSTDIIPSSLRDLFGFRWALRCLTPQASDTVLGMGQASRGFSAASIGGDDKGVGYLLREDKDPVRLRAFHLSDEDLAVLAERAEALRAAGKPPKTEGAKARIVGR